jgi:hypothetical protein
VLAGLEDDTLGYLNIAALVATMNSVAKAGMLLLLLLLLLLLFLQVLRMARWGTSTLLRSSTALSC